MVGGRPLKFESPQQMQELIDKYFAETPEEEITITGLALALDTNRHTLINYQNKDEFFHTIEKAKTRVELAYEKSLRKNGRTGDIFALKNFGWTDKQEIDAKVDNNNYNYDKLSDDEIDKLLEKLKNE